MNVKPEITVKNKLTGEKSLYRMDQTPLVIGRDAENFIVLPSKAVSRRHTEILYDRGQFFVRDLKSNNGTKLGERKIPTKEKNLLKSGDVIRIDDFDLCFEIPDKKVLSENTDSEILEVKMVKKLLRAMDKDSAPSLEVIDGPEKGRRFSFEAKSQDVVVGRDPSCEFFIDSSVISRKHARFEKRFDTVTLHDLKSKNGTFVNRQKIDSKRLQDGDVVHLGTLSIIFRNPQELGLDVGAPEISVSQPSIELSEKSVKEPEIPLPDARVAKRRGPDDPPPPAPKPAPQPIVQQTPEPLESFPAPHHEDAPPTPLEATEAASLPKLTSSEIAMIIVGLTVLVGALYGLFKLFQ